MERKVITTLTDLSWFDWSKSPIAIDTETTSLNYCDLDLLGISFCNGEQTIYVDFSTEKREFILAVRDYLSSGDNYFIFHNSPFDLKVLYKFGIVFDGCDIFDTCTAAHLIDEVDSVSLKYLASRDLHVSKVKEFDDVKIFGFHSQEFYDYAMNDAEWTWQLAQICIPKLYEQGLWDLWSDIEKPFQFCLMDLGINGILVDKKRLKLLQIEVKEKLDQVKKDIYDGLGLDWWVQRSFDSEEEYEIGGDLNLNSGKQLGEFIECKLKIKIPGKTDQGQSKTDAETLEKIQHKHPVIEMICNYKKLQKLSSSFLNKLWQHIDKDGRVRADFNNTGTITGRLSSSNPNLQNLPRTDSAIVDVRSVFIAPSGKKLMVLDFAGQELRITAAISQDPIMLEAFRTGRDLHQEVADECGIIRDAAKAINFGIIYGQTPKGLAVKLKIEESKAKEFIDAYYNTFPTIKKAIHKCHKHLKEFGYVVNLAGRRRRIPVHLIDNHAMRQSFNFIVQGTAAEQMRAAAVEIRRLSQTNPEWDLKFLLTVHDELVYEVNEEYANKVLLIVCRIAELAFPLEGVENKVSGGVGKDYSSAKKV